MSHAHSLSEWAAMTSLAVSWFGAVSVPYFVLVDADRPDFDPRPVLRRAVESGRFDPLLITVTGVRYDARLLAARARRLPRATALTAAALIALLLPTPGSTR